MDLLCVSMIMFHNVSLNIMINYSMIYSMIYSNFSLVTDFLFVFMDLPAQSVSPVLRLTEYCLQTKLRRNHRTGGFAEPTFGAFSEKDEIPWWDKLCHAMPIPNGLWEVSKSGSLWVVKYQFCSVSKLCLCETDMAWKVCPRCRPRSQ